MARKKQKVGELVNVGCFILEIVLIVPLCLFQIRLRSSLPNLILIQTRIRMEVRCTFPLLAPFLPEEVEQKPNNLLEDKKSSL